MNRLVATAVAGLMLSTSAIAQVDQEELALLREQVRLLTERLDALEESNAVQATELAEINETVGAATANYQAGEQSLDELIDQEVDKRFADMWTSRIKWKGDFRYRYESFDLEDADDRNRQRIRARANLEARITDTASVGLGLASGGDDPVSTNQTLGGGGSTKGLNLDLAYFKWKGMRNTEVVGGKFKNLLHRTGKNGLLWDGDWNPEGAGIRYDNDTFFASGLGTWVESDSREANQEFSYGVQAGFRLDTESGIKFVAGAGYYEFDTAGKSSFFGDDDDFFGNSYDPVTKTYLYNYHEVEAFAELSFDLFNRPTSLFVDYVTNTDADEYDTGWAYGFKSGSANDPGTWDFSVIYQDLEADAVLGLLTDSDFGGGGTNADGFILKGGYAIARGWKANFTYFDNEIGLNTDNPKDFGRLQLDLAFKYD
jgi:uncharacterized coiled-coil protein SlyX